MSEKPPDTGSQKVSKGLCDNCVNQEFCSYTKTTDKPVMFCEEYDCYVKLIDKYGIVLKPIGKEPPPDDEPSDDDE